MALDLVLAQESKTEQLDPRMIQAPAQARLSRPRKMGGTRGQAAKILQKTRPLAAVQARVEVTIAAMGAEEVGVPTAHKRVDCLIIRNWGFQPATAG